MDIYLILVIVLFALAFSDLIVGVSNDAVNFLNSAIGSKAAPRYVIMILASLGILVGATFSSGMMEVARKGIFFPDQFFFSEIMIIFVAVMLADVILLDLFNTFGMPTSTTVSIVFELLGAAVAVSLVKIYDAGGELSEYINSAKALAIIAGILLSIVVAFTVGTIIQYLTRIIFTFDYDKYLKYYGSIWGSIGITAITYFILIKGAKGSSFITPETLDQIKSNTMLIIGFSFLAWAILLQLIIWFTRINILKVIVLIGTFALAMAFAGNDLVNFIGVPLAGFSSFKIINATPGADPTSFAMSALAGKVPTDTYLLIIAGVVMAITLWLSKKARTVTRTEINLSRQGAGEERFGSSAFSRNLVRGSVSMSNSFNKVIPGFIRSFLDKRFSVVDRTKLKGEEKSSFDLLRASVNLTVASILISFATSLKLPLSTTYVTFMVAMGTSFGDGAWGRESAVYRISGVTNVIGGWFLTAFAAFVGAFTFALIIFYGGTIALTALVLLAAFFIIKTHALHKRKEKEKEKESSKETDIETELLYSDVLKHSSEKILDTLEGITISYKTIIDGLATEDRKKLKEAKKDVKTLNKKVKKHKASISNTIVNLSEENIEAGHFYVQILDHLREMVRSLAFISIPVYEHIDNAHKGLNDDQIEEFQRISSDVNILFMHIMPLIREHNLGEVQGIIEKQQEILDSLIALNKVQIKRIKHGVTGTKNGVLYLGVLTETKSLLIHTINMVKAQRDFIESSQSN
ncbi:MAG: inorganic phosphate transporter [Bacteroidota bacterium]